MVVAPSPVLEPITRISRDIRNSARLLTDEEARFLVDAYYQVQDFRIASKNQIRSIQQDRDEGDVQVPFLDWAFGSFEYIENTIKSGLDRYTDQSLIGRWSKSIVGIGPVIAAGLQAHLSGRERSSVGQIWAFAGLDPTRDWQRGQKRPWNTKLKVVCWKAGESFVKVQNNDNDFYGKVYAERKLYEWRKNLAGEYVEAARARVGHARWEKAGRNMESRSWWRACYVPKDGLAAEDFIAGSHMSLVENVGEGNGVPMLPPVAIQERSKRVAVKLFLSHWYHVDYEIRNGEPPVNGPYAISVLGHSGYIAPPNWPMD